MKIGFIGCGNMGGALAAAVAKNKGAQLYLADYDKGKADSLATALGALTCDNETAAAECDFLFLGVKPNMLPTVLSPLASVIKKNSSSVVVSMAAGVTLERLEALLGHPHDVIRIMPNTPVKVGEGMISWCASPEVSMEKQNRFIDLLSHAGKLDKISETNMDAATAVAGCGPAFVYMFIDALVDGGVRCGLSREQATSFACQTLRGASSMVLTGDKTPDALKVDVCSPGGSTIEGVAVLEERGFKEAVCAAVCASYEKNKLLGK